MNTPICDFISEYIDRNALRLHMPGHKGHSFLGYEALDITEINGADSLYHSDGIIKESEKNASKLFGADTFYSVEGTTLSIKAMLYLALMANKKENKRQTIIAGRNAHKAFIDAAAMLDFDIKWLYGSEEENYLSCNFSIEQLKDMLEREENITAVYITSPDYLGNISDIEKIAEICHKDGVFLLVDNAHGAYLKFLEKSMHPIDLGADIVCDSAHKTLPALTGGAYLHISKKLPQFFKNNVKSTLSLFGSTSPSYLILQSLDFVNKYLDDGYKKKLCDFLKKSEKLKENLKKAGYTLFGNEPLKITLETKSYGYFGYEFSKIMEDNNIICEFYDSDFVVFMLTPEIDNNSLEVLENTLLNVSKKRKIDEKSPKRVVLDNVLTVREAVFSKKEEVKIEDSIGRILASTNISCPPAVSIAVCGERITKEAVDAFRYYKKEKCLVVKQ